MASDDEYVFATIARTRDLLFRHATPAVRSAGLTVSQFEVLEALSSQGPLTVGGIREAVFGTKGTIPLVVKNLERDGLVSRSADPDDGRVSIISLTEEGRRRVETAYPEVVSSIGRDLAPLSEHEKDQLIRMLHKVESAARAAEGGAR